MLLALDLAPGTMVEAVAGGRVDADRLAYSDSFASRWRMSWLVALLVVMIGSQLAVVVRGRWCRCHAPG